MTAHAEAASEREMVSFDGEKGGEAGEGGEGGEGSLVVRAMHRHLILLASGVSDGELGPQTVDIVEILQQGGANRRDQSPETKTRS